MTIELLGAPRSVNHIWKSTCTYGYLHTYMTPEGKALKEGYQLQARTQYKGPLLTGPLSVSITYYLPDRRSKDLDNLVKLVADSLTGIVWEDDKQVCEYHLVKKLDKENPRTVLTINNLPINYFEVLS